LSDLLAQTGELSLVGQEADAHEAHLLLQREQGSSYGQWGDLPVLLGDAEVAPHEAREHSPRGRHCLYSGHRFQGLFILGERDGILQ
jgi:hypothetical protein